MLEFTSLFLFVARLWKFIKKKKLVQDGSTYSSRCGKWEKQRWQLKGTTWMWNFLSQMATHHFHRLLWPLDLRYCVTKRVNNANALMHYSFTYVLTIYMHLVFTYGSFTLDVTSMLNENLGGILGGTHY